jgi:hypothetical protein
MNPHFGACCLSIASRDSHRLSIAPPPAIGIGYSFDEAGSYIDSLHIRTSLSRLIDTDTERRSYGAHACFSSRILPIIGGWTTSCVAIHPPGSFGAVVRVTLEGNKRIQSS